VDGKGRRAAIEVMINTPLIQDHIRKGQVHEIKEVIKKSTNLGMQTFDQALFELYRDGVITYEAALAHADSANDLRLMIKLDAETRGKAGGPADDMPSFTLQDEDDSLNLKGSINVDNM
jgi:twitching motility protein PilU